MNAGIVLSSRYFVELTIVNKAKILSFFNGYDAERSKKFYQIVMIDSNYIFLPRMRKIAFIAQQ